jgi:hypothetical protein
VRTIARALENCLFLQYIPSPNKSTSALVGFDGGKLSTSGADVCTELAAETFTDASATLSGNCKMSQSFHQQ